jgi:peptidoglycan/LPS O-acetylase OafA/YrhL
MGETARIKWIDICKGVATLLVVMIHFNQDFHSPCAVVSKLASIGARGPQFFFIISAFLTWLSLSKKNQLPVQSYGSFLHGRFKRILPEYYLALILAIVTFFCGLGYPEQLTGWGYLSHILLINGFIPNQANSILIVEWYVSDLIIFYLFAPFIHKLVNNLNRSLIFLLISLLVSIVFHYLTMHIVDNKDYYSTLCIIIQMPVMAIGVVLFYLLKEINEKGIKTYLKVTALFALTGVVSLMLFLKLGCVSKSFLAGIVFGWICYTLSVLESSGSTMNCGWLALLGKYSLGIYLFHMFIIKLAHIIPFSLYSTANLFVWLLSFMVVLAISTIVGYSTHLFIKKIAL